MYAYTVAPLIIVINLSYRTDRKERIIQHLNAWGFEYTILNAIDGRQIDETKNPSPPNVAACWLSHQLAAKYFLQSSHRFAWILEDDAVISDDALSFFKEDISSLEREVDIFQLGYNVQKNRVASGYFDQQLHLAKKFLCLLADLCEVFRLPSNFFCSLHWLEKKVPTKMQLIKNRFETGTHCYLISRYAAAQMLNFNNPVLLPADVAMCELSKTQLKMYRPTKSLVVQTDSPSSIPVISNEIFEMRLKDLLDDSKC